MERRCAGDGRQYRVCAMQACPPDVIPFRAMQCALYNPKPVLGSQERYEWVPFLAAPNPCDLICQAVGHSFYHTFGRVLDGTKCLADSEGMCINGRCLVPGCDGVLGSSASEDKCGQCQGRTGACVFIHRVFRASFPSSGFFGYKNVTRIPAGATQVKVTDRSRNLLALMNARRRYVINGDWAVSWPGVYEVAGTQVHYTRSSDDHEVMEALGPTEEDLHVMLLFQEQNPGVEYEYWLPRDLYSTFHGGASALRQPQPPQEDLGFWNTVSPDQKRATTTSGPLHTPERSAEMILRSRKIPVRELSEPTTPRTPRPRNSDASPRTPKTPRTPGLELRAQRAKRCRSSLCGQEEEELFTKPIKRASRGEKMKRKRSEEIQGLEETPLKSREMRVHFQLDEPFLGKPELLSSIYSPVINFFSPHSGDRDCCSHPMQKVKRKRPRPEDAPYFSELPIDDSEDLFSRHSFVYNLPPPSDSPSLKRKDIPFKTRSAPESTLVLDLDDTLVRCSLSPSEDTEFTFPILFQDIYYKVYMKLRPHVREFLETLSKMYEMFVFTTAKKEYAEKVLDVLDPQRKLIRHRLFQEDCVCFLGHYIKNLKVLQRDLAKTVILDDAPHTCPYQNFNRIPVKSWLGDPEDEELLRLIPVLEKMTQVDDVRTEISQRFHCGELLAEF
ncbi:ADAMTS-like protein 5 isoform X2 [Lissotriton helveticus]